ncbi:hypothetical protein COCNU_04G002610 [Cocos nucifera]|uniref:Transmembrane protein n=1 Tax=Cocos nucifera TaxID=13894 RepID=A0A8K0MZD4_COCNU|nr:hypothetical protein COCNU_04G002610 [Cocos nucifera]
MSIYCGVSCALSPHISSPLHFCPNPFVPSKAQTLEHLEMGIIRSSFSFLLGTGCGVYIAQNYNVPDIKKLVNTWLFVAKHVEETYKKPKQKDED